MDATVEVGCCFDLVVISIEHKMAGELPTLHTAIGGTEYVVTGQLSQTANETAVDKMRRIILSEASKLSQDT